MSTSDLGFRVKQLRNKRGFSQEQLAEKAGVSLRTIQRIENGETQSTGATLKLLASALDVNPDELLDWTLKEDTGYLKSMNLASLLSVIFPPLGVLVPAIMWVSKKDKLKGINEVARALINFQITWLLLFFLIPLLTALLVWIFIGNLVMSLILMASILYIVLMYALNVVQVIINSFRIQNQEPVRYTPSIKFIR